MDDKIKQELKNFDAVWKRVKNSSGKLPVDIPIKLMPRKQKQGYAVCYAPYNK